DIYVRQGLDAPFQFILIHPRPPLTSSSISSFFFQCYGAHRAPHSFPTRRSSDLSSTLVTRRTSSTVVVPCIAFSMPSARIMVIRSEEHTSELQSRGHLVCRLLLEKKKSRCRRPLTIGKYTGRGVLHRGRPSDIAP